MQSNVFVYTKILTVLHDISVDKADPVSMIHKFLYDKRNG